mgnify:CR=1 FL=1
MSLYKKIIISLIAFSSSIPTSIFADDLLIAHAKEEKIVKIRFVPTECKRIKTVKDSSTKKIEKRVVTSGVSCPNSQENFVQRRILRNHQGTVSSGHHNHHNHQSNISKGPSKKENKSDNNSCKEGSVIGGLLGAGVTMSATRGKDRWWAVPAGGAAGAMIGCQIDGG